MTPYDVPPDLFAEYEKLEKQRRHADSWWVRLVLWWYWHFPPKNWKFVCSSCGKRTSDKGEGARPSICSRPSCKQKYIDAVIAEHKAASDKDA